MSVGVPAKKRQLPFGSLCRRNFYMCSKEVTNLAYDMIVCPHLEYASTCWNPYTKRDIDKLEAVLCRAARFVLSFYDYHPTAVLIGEIQKSLQWVSLHHRNTVADLYMFYVLRNNLASIAIPPILVPYVKNNSHYNHIQSIHSDAFIYHFFSGGVTLWNIIPCHLATKPSLESFCTAAFQLISPLQWYKHPGTNTWCLVQNSAYFLLLLFAVFVVKNLLFICIIFLLYLFNVCLHNYWHFSVMFFMLFLE